MNDYEEEAESPQAYVERARSIALISRHKLATNARRTEILERVVEAERLASNSKSLEEALAHFADFDTAYRELLQLEAEEAARANEILETEDQRLKLVEGYLDGSIEPGPGATYIGPSD